MYCSGMATEAKVSHCHLNIKQRLLYALPPQVAPDNDDRTPSHTVAPGHARRLSPSNPAVRRPWYAGHLAVQRMCIFRRRAAIRQ